jgi:hypothetical protein
MTRLQVIGAALALLPAAALAQDPGGPAPRSDFYVGAAAGLAYFSEIEGAEYDLGGMIAGLAGLEFRPNRRLELELAYESAEFENSADATSLLRTGVSLYADLDRPLRRDWVPYVGGGGGIALIDVGNDEDNTELTGHIEAGLTVPLGGNLELVPGLRLEYIALEDIDDQIITQFRAGLRLRQ